MNDDVPRSAELDALLSRARKAGPPRPRLDAVRARLESELGPLAPSDGAAPAPSGEAAPAAPSWLAPAGLAALLALGLAAFLALRSGPERPPPGLADEQPTVTPAASAHEPPSTVPPSAPTAEEPPPAEESSAAAAAPEETPARPRTPRAAPTTAADETVPEPVDPGSSLREEVVLLERAMSRRRAGDVSGARAALAEHARRFPEGHLAPERERLGSELDAEAGEP